VEVTTDCNGSPWADLKLELTNKDEDGDGENDCVLKIDKGFQTPANSKVHLSQSISSMFLKDTSSLALMTLDSFT